MIGSEAFIDVSLKNIWRSWFVFRKGKCSTSELHDFQYYLEKNLFELFKDLNDGGYRHGGYKKFVVSDNKRREISVASVRDRIVHRLVYDYLVLIYDKTFIYDAWSCRAKKGLLGAIERAQKFLGVVLWPHGHRLNKRNMKRVREKLTLNNAGSYYGILKYHANYKKMKEFHWSISEKIFTVNIVSRLKSQKSVSKLGVLYFYENLG